MPSGGLRRTRWLPLRTHEPKGRLTRRERLRATTAANPGQQEGLMIEPQRFEKFVAEAFDSLPQWVLERLENVEVLVEEHRPRGEPNLLGRYHGIPMTKRSNYWGVPPDTITLYRSTIERSE